MARPVPYSPGNGGHRSVKWLFWEDPGSGWRWELWDDAGQMIAYEDGFKTAADATKSSREHGYPAAARDWINDL